MDTAELDRIAYLTIQPVTQGRGGAEKANIPRNFFAPLRHVDSEVATNSNRTLDARDAKLKGVACPVKKFLCASAPLRHVDTKKG